MTQLTKEQAIAFCESEGLHKELYGEKEPPTLEEIINLIPEDKRVLI